MIKLHGLNKRTLSKAVSSRKESTEAVSRAEQFAAITATSHSNTQQLQLQNQMLQHQLRLAQLQLQAKQQELMNAQARAQSSAVTYPQLVARVARSVNRLVASAYREKLPLEERQELALIAEELLTACGPQ